MVRGNRVSGSVSQNVGFAEREVDEIPRGEGAGRPKLGRSLVTAKRISQNAELKGPYLPCNNEMDLPVARRAAMFFNESPGDMLCSDRCAYSQIPLANTQRTEVFVNLIACYLFLRQQVITISTLYYSGESSKEKDGRG